MNYDVQIGNTIRRGISYAELVTFPIEPETFVRRTNGDWIQAKDCVELTHILAQRQLDNQHAPVYWYRENWQSQNSNIVEDYDYSDNEDYAEYEDEQDNEAITPYTSQYAPQFPGSEALPYQPFCQGDEEEERIFIPTAEYFKCKQKRKAAIIGVCTLGLAGLSLTGVGNTWRSNIFAGTSFSANAGIGFVLKCLSFCFLTALIAIPYFIYSVFALIYYSVRLSNLKR